MINLFDNFTIGLTCFPVVSFNMLTKKIEFEKILMRSEIKVCMRIIMGNPFAICLLCYSSVHAFPNVQIFGKYWFNRQTLTSNYSELYHTQHSVSRYRARYPPMDTSLIPLSIWLTFMKSNVCTTIVTNFPLQKAKKPRKLSYHHDSLSMLSIKCSCMWLGWLLFMQYVRLVYF